MAIKYYTDAQGGFTCGDTVTRMTSYAYPSSANAQQARKAPLAIAMDMLAGEVRYGLAHEADYDERNWTSIECKNRVW